MPPEPDLSFAATFAQALLNPTLTAPALVTGPNGKAAGKRYAVYRNNVTVSLIDALAAIYPAVQRITGPDFFRAVDTVKKRAQRERTFQPLDQIEMVTPAQSDDARAAWRSSLQEAIDQTLSPREAALIYATLKGETPLVNSASTDPTIPETIIPWLGGKRLKLIFG